MPNERAIDRMLEGKIKERSEKVRSLKVMGDYYHRGTSSGSVFCRYCGEMIVGGGKVLSNYRTVEFDYEGGGVHRSNCCVQCVPKINSIEAVEAHFMSDVESWARSEEKEGKSKEEHASRYKAIHERTLKLDGMKVIIPGVGREK